MNPLFPVFFQKHRQVISHLNEALKEHGLFHAQWTILYLLEKNGEMSLTEIWKYLHVEPPTVTRTVARLEVLGWLERVETADKREKVVALSNRAKEQFPKILASIEAFEQHTIKNLSLQEQQQLIELLNKLEG